jgi:nitrogenase molybdenum-iron protein alpha/beta subunit
MALKTYKNPEPNSPECIRDEKWLQVNIRELVKKYPDKWIAVLGEKVVAVGDDLGEVTLKVEAEYPDTEPLFHLVEATDNVYSHTA